MSKSHPDVLAGLEKPRDSLHQAVGPASVKRALLDHLLDKAGPLAVLSIGEGLMEGDFDPLWQVAVRARSPEIFFKGWRRMEGYAHSTNRLAFDQQSVTSVLCQRYSVGDAPAPGFAENLLICGLVIILLQKIGCKDLVCRLPETSGPAIALYEQGQFNQKTAEALGNDLNSWSLTWTRCERPASKKDEDAADLPLPEDCPAATRRLVERAAGLLAEDHLRQWKVAELAHELGVSQRSFQRRLTEARWSFSGLVRALRIQEACRLLQDRENSLTLVGFCAGFSDSAHFSRDFKAGTGTTPTAFRKAIAS
ncbi:helix-turn-helix transcriptional regulator [Rhodovibrionaceae bacterium A322]